MTLVQETIRRLDDLQVIELFDFTEKLFGLEAFERVFQIAGAVTVLPESEQEQSHLSGRYLYSYAKWSIGDASKRQNLSIIYRKGMRVGDAHQKLYPAMNSDVIEVNFPHLETPWREDPSLIKDLFIKIRQFSAPAGVSGSLVGDSFSELVQSLGSQHRQMISDLHDQFSSIEKAKLELTKKVEAERALLEEQHQDKIRELDEIRADLETERQKLDLESYRSRRRNDGSELIKKLSTGKSFGPSTLPSRALFFVIPMICLYIGGFAGFFAIDTTSYLAQTALSASLETNWLNISIIYLVLKSIASTVVCFGAGLYALNWFKRGQIVMEERLHQAEDIANDIARATWVIEAYLELSQEHKADVPPQWMDGVTKGLFNKTSTVSADAEQMLALKALLGVSGGMKASAEGIEVDIGKRDARRLSK